MHAKRNPPTARRRTGATSSRDGSFVGPRGAHHGAPPSVRPGLLVASRYRLLAPIRSGGMGAVWRARNELTEREFAVKFLLSTHAADPEIARRFLQEARITGRLQHPNIVELFDVGAAPELDGAPFLVMELLRGVPLDVALQGGPLPLRLALLVAQHIARALSAAHASGVIHRDVKPANVFLHRAASGVVVPKLLDFGVGKLAAGADGAASGHTMVGAMLGSPGYMSPEQVRGSVDVRTDVHALGILLWWALVGESPFAARSMHDFVVEVTRRPRPRLPDVAPWAPPAVGEIVARAFAIEMEHRYASAEEMARALDAALASVPGAPLESPEWAALVFHRATRAASAPSHSELLVHPAPSAPSAPPAKVERTELLVSIEVEPAATRGSANGGSTQLSADAPDTSEAPSARRRVPTALALALLAAVAALVVIALGARDGRSPLAEPVHTASAREPRAALASPGAPPSAPPADPALARAPGAPSSPASSPAPPPAPPPKPPAAHPSARRAAPHASPAPSAASAASAAAPKKADPSRGIETSGL